METGPLHGQPTDAELGYRWLRSWRGGDTQANSDRRRRHGQHPNQRSRRVISDHPGRPGPVFDRVSLDAVTKLDDLQTLDERQLRQLDLEPGRQRGIAGLPACVERTVYCLHGPARVTGLRG